MTFPRYESYKESGVPWLGEIPSYWEIKKAKFLWQELEERSVDGNEQLLSVSQYSGVVPREEDSRSNDLVNYKKCAVGDLVINIMLAWMGGLGIAEQNGIVSPAYSVYRQRDNNNSKYFGYLYRTSIYLAEFARRSTGVVPSRWRMYTEDFGQVLTLVPPIEEQERIARFLDERTAAIDAAIAKKERLLALLAEQKAIMINTAVTRGLDPHAPLKDSGISWLGRVPAHWEVKANRYIFSEQNNRSEKGEETHLSMSQKLGLVPSSELDVLTLQSESYEGAKLCLEGDLVLNRLKAHLAVFSVAPCEGLVSPDYSVFRLIDAEFNPFYFENLFKTPVYLSEFNRRVRGIVVGFYRLYSDDFKSIACIVPPASEQDEIMKHILLLTKKSTRVKRGIEKEIEVLKELKSVMIAEAVTGQIKL